MVGFSPDLGGLRLAVWWVGLCSRFPGGRGLDSGRGWRSGVGGPLVGFRLCSRFLAGAAWMVRVDGVVV